jgi:hypothetical protein
MSSFLSGQQAAYARAFLGDRISKFQAARQRQDAGASAIELAIITAILVGLAVGVLVIVTTVVTNRSTQITTNNGQIP